MSRFNPIFHTLLTLIPLVTAPYTHAQLLIDSISRYSLAECEVNQSPTVYTTNGNSISTIGTCPSGPPRGATSYSEVQTTNDQIFIAGDAGASIDPGGPTARVESISSGRVYFSLIEQTNLLVEVSFGEEGWGANTQPIVLKVLSTSTNLIDDDIDFTALDGVSSPVFGYGSGTAYVSLEPGSYELRGYSRTRIAPDSEITRTGQTSWEVTMTECGAIYIAGDININCKVDIQDLLMMQQAMTNLLALTPQQMDRADMHPVNTGDGILDTSDLQELQKNLIGL